MANNTQKTPISTDERRPEPLRVQGSSPISTDGSWPKRLKKTSSFLLRAALFLGPLAFLPFGNFLGLGKQTIFGILVLLAFAFWLVRVLFAGQFSYQKSATLKVVALLVAGCVIGFIFHQAKYQAFFGGSGNFLCLFNILVLSALFWLLNTRNQHQTLHKTDTKPLPSNENSQLPSNEAKQLRGCERAAEEASSARFSGSSSAKFRGLKWFLWGAGVAILFSISQLFGFYFIPASFARSASFNTVGTVNSVAILAGLILTISMGLIGTQNPHQTKTKQTRNWWLWALVVIAGFYVLLVGYLPVWYGLIGASFIYFARGTRNTHETKHETNTKLRGKVIIPVFVIFLVAVIALSMNFVRGQNVLNLSRVFNIQTPLEVAPSQGTSFAIAKKVYDEGWVEKIFGSGWGSYSKKWKLYKKQDINWSAFWALGFSQGASGFATMLVEGGLLITLLFAALFGAMFWDGIRLQNWAKTGGALFMFILWFFYPFNFTLWMAVFVLGTINAR